MKVVFEEQRTFEGFTYMVGEHEVDDALGARLLATFPRVCKRDEDQETDGGDEGAGGEATPAARALADEHGVDLSQVEGTGSGGRITVRDVRGHIA